MPTEFTLPELGEGVAGGDILRLLVSPGDMLAKDQAVFELETDKATIEVPSSVAGRVREVKVKEGQTVKVGQVILTVDDDAAAPAPAAAASEPGPAAPPKSAVPAKPDVPPPAAPIEVEERRAAPVEPTPRRTDEGTVVNPASVAAPPSVRRLARELGVDIGRVAGSASDGRVSDEDVKAHARKAVGSGGGPIAEPLPDFSRWGAIERQPMRAVRRKTAEHLSAAWATIPHVTQHSLADITNLDEIRKTYAKQVEAAGGSLTVTSIAVKVVAAALRVFPQFNASIDLAAEEIISKKYVHIGVAVDTDRGLLVPVLKDADKKSMTELSIELLRLSDKARTRKIALEDMQGGCFSVSNLGGIGGSYFTPIINAPEVAILGISRARMEPVYNKESGQFVPRLMLPLSLSYDHRVIDGADGARFLRWVVEAFEQPFLLSL